MIGEGERVGDRRVRARPSPTRGLCRQDEGGAWRQEMRTRGFPWIDAKCLETKLNVDEAK